MCGIAGYHSVPQEKRNELATYLGWLIDTRGGDAAGYVSVGDVTRTHHKLGTWETASKRFMKRASAGHVLMMHSRYTTHGHKGIANAHPFTIRRNDKSVLHGCHNGMLYGTEASAKKHGRSWSVDSKEMLELLADGEKDEIQRLTGYGIVTWVPHGTDEVRFAKLSSDGAIDIVELTDGGIVWASTPYILNHALEVAELEVKQRFNVSDTGRVYIIRDGMVFRSEETGIRVDSRSSWLSGYTGRYGWGEAGDTADYTSDYAWKKDEHGAYVKVRVSDGVIQASSRLNSEQACDLCAEPATRFGMGAWLCAPCFRSWGVSEELEPQDLEPTEVPSQMAEAKKVGM